MLGRLFNALPRFRLRGSGRRLGRAPADLGADIDDDQSLDGVGPLGGHIHRVTAAHREPNQHQGLQSELVDDPADVGEGRDGGVDIRPIAVPVPALVEGVHVEVRLQRDAERIPRVGMTREPVQEEERRTAPCPPSREDAVGALALPETGQSDAGDSCIGSPLRAGPSSGHRDPCPGRSSHTACGRPLPGVLLCHAPPSASSPHSFDRAKYCRTFAAICRSVILSTVSTLTMRWPSPSRSRWCLSSILASPGPSRRMDSASRISDVTAA